jgi:hypothetical protein
LGLFFCKMAKIRTKKSMQRIKYENHQSLKPCGRGKSSGWIQGDIMSIE